MMVIMKKIHKSLVLYSIFFLLFMIGAWINIEVVSAQDNLQVDTMVTQPWEAKNIDVPALSELLKTTTQEADKIPDEAAKETQEGLKRPFLMQRVSLLKELISVVQARSDVKTEIHNLPKKIQQLNRQLDQFDTLPELYPPASPTSKGLAELMAKLEQSREALEKLRQEDLTAKTRLEHAGEIRRKYAEAASNAEQTIETLKAEGLKTESKAEQLLIDLQLENASLQKRLSQEVRKQLIDEAVIEQKAATYRSRLLGYLAQKVARQEKEFRLYGKAILARFETEKIAKEEELAEKQKAVEEAETKQEQFIAGYEAQIAESRAHITELKTRNSKLANLIQRGEKTLLETNNRMQAIEWLLEKKSIAAYVGRRLQAFHKEAQEIRRSIHRLGLDDIQESSEEHQRQRFDLEDQNLNLKHKFERDVQLIIETLPEIERTEFWSRAEELRSSLQKTYISEIDTLTKIIQTEEKVGELVFELLDIVDRAEQLFTARIYFIRDSKPLNDLTFSDFEEEFQILHRWFLALGQALEEHRLKIFQVKNIIIVFILLILLPAVLLVVRKKILQRLGMDSKVLKKMWAIAVAILSIVLLPAYLLFLAFLFRSITLTNSLNLFLYNFFMFMAASLFIWFFGKTLFGPQNMAVTLFNMNPALSASLLKFVNRLVLIRFLFLFIPYLHRREPLVLETIPLIGELFYAIILILLLYLLLRGRSPLGKGMQQLLGHHFLARNWGLVIFTVLGVMLAAVILGSMGYNYGSKRIYDAVFHSVLVSLLMVGFYRILNVFVSEQQMVSDSRTDTERMTFAEKQVILYKWRRQIGKFLKSSFIIITIVILAGIWGIDQQVLKSLDSIDVYSISTSAGIESVTLADITLAVTVLVIMTLLLKYLPGIYDIIIFPRINLEAGLRYALLTISRYGIFALACIIALSYIHLDLGRIGWLMAAVGFGLGFGMQEIFSNFVSGLIMLVERPVRVGDIVKVGEVLGQITRINIRATTVKDYDQVEIVIPNKDFITKEVTNWTLGDRIIRVIVPIGVAYGTEPKEVIDLLVDIANEDSEVLDEPEPTALFLEHGDSSLNFELRCFIGEADRRLNTKSRLNVRINEVLAEKGIEIPFPQRDLHIRNDGPLSDDLRKPELSKFTRSNGHKLDDGVANMKKRTGLPEFAVAGGQDSDGDGDQ
jgi:potassium efflux system protein